MIGIFLFVALFGFGVDYAFQTNKERTRERILRDLKERSEIDEATSAVRN